jgi:copper chaperone CopZ
MHITLAIIGMIDLAAAQAVEAAVHGVDPAAVVTISLPAGLVAVDTVASSGALCAAIEARGFIAEPTTRTLPKPRPSLPNGAMPRLFGRALLWGLAWFLFSPLVVFVVTFVVATFDPVCGTPGDSGGCEMGVVSISASAAPIGGMLAFAITLIRGLVRMRRAAAAGAVKG